MKRFLPVLGIVFILPVAFAVLLVLSASSKDRGKWQPLPNGGEISFRGVTHGVRHVMSHSAIPLSEKLSKALRFHSWRPLVEKPGAAEFSAGSTPNLGVWFAIRGRSDTPLPQKAELHLGDGQVYYTYSGGGSGGSGHYLAHTSFRVIPFTTEKLKVSALFDDKRFEWEIPNPTYDPTQREETADPLPHTREAGGLRITLSEIKLERVDYPPTNWRAEPVLKIFSDGKDVTQWFSVWPEISDGALLSAPVWRVKVPINRSKWYPFAAEEVQWVGTFDKDSAKALEPGKYVLFPPNEAASALGLRFAGMFGPGQYDVHGITVTSAGPLVDDKMNQPARSDYLHEQAIIRLYLKEPACIVFEQFWRSGVEVFWDQAGQPNPLREVWSSGSGEGRLRICQLPDKPLRFGVADRNVSSLAGETVEFVVRPPGIPVQKNGADK